MAVRIGRGHTLGARRRNSEAAGVVPVVASDTTAPVLTAGALPATASVLNVPWSVAPAATDAVGVTGYATTVDTVTVPSLGAFSALGSGVVFAAAGAHTVRIYARDSAGNISAARTTACTVTLSPATVNRLGANLFYNTDYDSGYIFADLVKQGRYFSVPGNWPNRAPLDANGWPTADAQIGLILKDPNTYDPSGVYKLSFAASTPNVVITAIDQNPAQSVTITNQVYSNGVITADVTLTAAALCLILTFTNTGDGVRNVRLIRPGSTAQDVFAPEMVQAMSVFKAIRPMQMTGEPANPAVNWTQRRTGAWPIQSNEDETEKIGVSYEYLVLLANTLHQDLWLCLPRNASDDYLTKAAQLVRYGSDGVNPYTSTQANPVFPPLDPSLNLYVEYSNEVWNYNLLDERAKAQTEVLAGDPNHFTYDGAQADSWACALRRVVTQGMRISQIFRQVFGDSQMPVTGNSRIRPVLGSQFDFPGQYDGQLQYLADVWGPANTYGNPQRPAAYYFYALTGAPYPTFSSTSDTLTVDDVFDLLENSDNGMVGCFNYLDRIASSAANAGIKFVAYEGGQSIWRTGHSDAATAAAQTDDRMRLVTERLLAKYYSLTDEPFFYFTLGGAAGDYFPATKNGWGDTNVPKWQALRNVAQGLGDAIAPTMTAGALPANASALTVAWSVAPVATDAVGVTGYATTVDTATVPLLSEFGPAGSGVTFASAGAHTVRIYARDAAGNVSAARTTTCTVTLADVTAPVVTAGDLPANASALTVAWSVAPVATDAVGVTGYATTVDTATVPALNAFGSAGSGVTFASAGAHTVRIYARDSAGNISAARTTTCTVTLADVTAPVVTAGDLPANASALTVAWSVAPAATDAVGVTGYATTIDTATVPALSAFGPAGSGVTFASAGLHTVRIYARDSAGNISAARTTTCTVTLIGATYFDTQGTLTGADGDALPATWNGLAPATGDQFGGRVRKTDNAGYTALFCTCGGSLPADYYLTFRVPNATLTGYVGWTARHIPVVQDAQFGTAVQVFMPGDRSALRFGYADINGGAYELNNAVVTVTGGYPASWLETTHEHEITFGFAGNTVTIYLDGAEYGYFTAAFNAQAGTGCAMTGEGQGRLISRVRATDYLPAFVP